MSNSPNHSYACECIFQKQKKNIKETAFRISEKPIFLISCKIYFSSQFTWMILIRSIKCIACRTVTIICICTIPYIFVWTYVEMMNVVLVQSWWDPCTKPQRRTSLALRGHHRHPPVLSAAQKARAHLQGDDSRRGEFSFIIKKKFSWPCHDSFDQC